MEYNYWIRIPRSSATDFSYLMNETNGRVDDDQRFYVFETLEELLKMKKFLDEEEEKIKALEKEEQELINWHKKQLIDLYQFNDEEQKKLDETFDNLPLPEKIDRDLEYMRKSLPNFPEEEREEMANLFSQIEEVYIDLKNKLTK